MTLCRRIKQGIKYQGLGLHSTSDMHRLVQEDLRTVSSILGKNKFISGNELGEDDCAVFGFLAQALWGIPGSPYEQLIKSEGELLPNIASVAS